MLLRWLIHNMVMPAVKERVIEGVSQDVRQSREPADTVTQRPLPPCEIAIVFGSKVEAEATRLRLTREALVRRSRAATWTAGMLAGRSVIVAYCGPNGSAAGTVEALLDSKSPEWVISAGFAAGLREELRRGHIVMPQRLVAENESELTVDFRIADGVAEGTRGLQLGRLVTVDHLVRTPEQRQELADRFGAVACDTDAMGIAKVCRNRKAKFLAVRVVSEVLNDRLPPEIEAMLAQSSLASKLGAAAGAMLNRPASVQDLWRMKEAGMKASSRLTKFLAGVVPQLT